MVTIVRSGYMKRYSKSILSGGWQTVWVVLYSDSNLVLYKRQGDMEIKGKANMKEVCKRFAYGQYTDTFPDRPSLPSGASIGQLFAIPTKNNSQAKVYWLLCSSESDLNDWMTSICSTLPARPQSSKQQQQHPPQQPPIQPQTAAPVSYAPPPYQPALPPQPQPPSNIGFAGIAGGGYPQAPAPYPAQPSGYPANPYPAQPAPGYQPYPQQAYAPPPPAAYPQQQYQQPYGYAPAPGAYQPPPQGYAQPPGQQVVYVQQPHKKSGGLGGLGGSNTTKIAAGLIGGAALGYGASRMMGGFGGFGFGRHGSWSSLSSFGSCGSFGSFGSFD